MELSEQEAWTLLNALTTLKDSHTKELATMSDLIDREFMEQDLERIDAMIIKLAFQYNVSYGVALTLETEETPDGPITFLRRVDE